MRVRSHSAVDVHSGLGPVAIACVGVLLAACAGEDTAGDSAATDPSLQGTVASPGESMSAVTPPPVVSSGGDTASGMPPATPPATPPPTSPIVPPVNPTPDAVQTGAVEPPPGIPTTMMTTPVPVMMPTVGMQEGAGAPSDFPGMGDGGSDAMGAGGGSVGGTDGMGGATSGGIPDVITDLTDVVIDGRPANEQCMFCHGFDGEGTDEAPEIQHPVEDFATWVIRTGREHPDYDDPMPAYTEEELPDEALAAIFTFLQSLPMPTTGEGLFHDHCANCHGDDARGGVTTRDITAEAFLMGFQNHVRMGAHAGDFPNRREYMHAYTADEISDAEINMIFDYVQSL